MAPKNNMILVCLHTHVVWETRAMTKITIYVLCFAVTLKPKSTTPLPKKYCLPERYYRILKTQCVFTAYANNFQTCKLANYIIYIKHPT